MPTKIKTTQPETPNEKQGRDFFQTPNYATELLLPFIPKDVKYIWEPACGNFKISNILKNNGYHVYNSDLGYPDTDNNFLTDEFPFDFHGAIITNPPYSLKRKFYERCRYHNVPFALLIPFDISGWICKAVEDGCKFIIPERRIDYITPNGKFGKTSSSQFHSVWLTYGFLAENQLNVVPLSLENKKNI